MRSGPRPLRVVSLFCGLGGADLGLYRAADDLGIDVEVVDAVDSWEPAVRVYNANQRHPVARVADVKQMTHADLPPHDLVIGGPPCQDHSLAGERKCRCHLGGYVAPRCCLTDFLRLADGSPYIMENVRARLISAPFSVQLCAADFGDVTERRRWYYSNYLLHVTETPGPRRIRDIREAGMDKLAKDRSAWLAEQKRTAKRWGVTARGDDDFIGSLGSGDWHGMQSGSALLKIAMRSASFRETDRVLDENGFLGSVVANSYRASNQEKIEGCRNPSLLEMARAHSLPDNLDWAGATKTDRGKMIANCWPVGMATAVCKAMLSALIAELERAA